MCRARPVHGRPVDSARCCCSTSAITIRNVHHIWVLSNKYAIWNRRNGMCTIHTAVNTAVVLCSTPCDRE